MGLGGVTSGCGGTVSLWGVMHVVTLQRDRLEAGQGMLLSVGVNTDADFLFWEDCLPVGECSVFPQIALSPPLLPHHRLTLPLFLYESENLTCYDQYLVSHA